MELHLFQPSAVGPAMCKVCGHRQAFAIGSEFIHTNHDVKMTIDLPIQRLNQPVTPALSSKIYNASNPPPDHDPVTSPSHYTGYKITPVEVIEDWNLDFHLGSAIKYIGRFPKKEGLQDLRKAHWYLSRKIELMEKEIQPNEPPRS